MRRQRPMYGSNDMIDSDDFTGVDGLATQGSTDVTQNTASPGSESNPIAGYDFGLDPLSAIGNYIWVDRNSDGFQEPGEPSLPNVTVELYDGTSATPVATTVTDGNGGYLFDNLKSGTYYVRVDADTLPSGMAQTQLRLPGADFGNQDQTTVIPNSGGLTGYKVALAGGETNPTGDFGYNYATGAIGDRVWVDTDGNGVQDAGEPGIGGVTVEIRLREWHWPARHRCNRSEWQYRHGHHNHRAGRQLHLHKPA